ncbi:hypothetical protein GCM10010911_03580 [Paenibacillus nasutitermitis]|uniref:Phosphodiester glycosidase domain-containing protein n=1 Tax=Paenibacillus nasutitermitis TaxID=1652958 RepID=A0A917DL82_9BACL|nr:hypothetical protein GCM10010911_03580 [Paenibacillus nasutitermitis]
MNWKTAGLAATMMLGVLAVPLMETASAVPYKESDKSGINRTASNRAQSITAEEPAGQVTLTYPKASVALTAGTREFIGSSLIVSEKVALTYQTGNPAVAKVNTAGVITAAAAGSTTLTITVVSTGYKGQLKLPVKVSAAQPLKLGFSPKLESRKVTAGGKSFSVSMVTIPKGMPVTAGIAGRSVGATQPLSAIAKNYNADIAINGTFFDAYSGVPDPYGNIIRDGLPEHIGNLGTTIGFKWDGSAVMDSLRIKIFGNVEGSERTSGWYAYFINRKPTSGSAATLFTPARGAKLGFAAASAVIVENGNVKRIAYGENAEIPKNGYVLVFLGAEKGQAGKFKVGDKVSYNVEYQDMNGNKLDWSQVHTAIGAGPRLVKDGKVSLNAADEGFRDPKILSGGGARSGIAILKDGSVIIATVSGATMKQWAQVMVQLGARQAMNLDGGASSGLWYKGKSVTSAGRELSNALLFGEKLKW